MLLRDGDGGLERFFGRRRVGGIALEQHFAADAMQLGVERAMADPFARRQRFVEDGERAVDVARAGFGLGKRNLDEPVVDQNVLLAQKFGAAAHVLEPAAGAPLSACAKPSRNIPNARHSGRSCSRASRASSTAFGAARERSPRISSNMAACIFPYARVPIWARPAIRASASPNEGNRALDVAQRPQREREVEHCRDAGVLSEAEGQIVVTAGLEQGERPFADGRALRDTLRRTNA